MREKLDKNHERKTPRENKEELERKNKAMHLSRSKPQKNL